MRARRYMGPGAGCFFKRSRSRGTWRAAATHVHVPSFSFSRVDVQCSVDLLGDSFFLSSRFHVDRRVRV